EPTNPEEPTINEETGEPGKQIDQSVNQAPIISHQPVLSVNDTENLQIHVEIEDDQETLTANLFYQTNEAFSVKTI
ncbi:hypothetical protein, partial [Cohnella sp. GbtcB17]|uniref:hypothetical protein n=1 Tax=Cohnella sp. GbtcB17 TaxID=2824762 RepID=UPI001C2FA4E8